MYRNMVNTLAAWSEDPEKKMLLLKGPLHVGKSWCVMDFAEAFYKKTLHIEFDRDAVLRELFMTAHTPEFIEEQLELLAGVSFRDYSANELLLVFDEVQVEEDLFAGVMQYIRQRRGRSVILIASWMGSLPAENLVAEELQVEYMYPMSFEEFLIANKAQELCKIIEQEKVDGLKEDIRPVILEYLKYFYITGGMPEVVQSFVKNRSMNQVDIIGHRNLQEMRDYVIKHAPKQLV